MEPVPPALRRASSGTQHRHGLARGLRPPPHPKLWVFDQQGGKSTFGCLQGVLGEGQAGRGGYRRYVYVQPGTVQPARCRWLRTQRVCSSRSDVWIVMGPGLTNPHPATRDKRWTLTADPAAQPPLLLGNTLNSNTRPPQLSYRDQPPANLTSSSMATAISTTNVF